MAHDKLLGGLILLAALGWLFSAVGWARVFTAGGDDLRLEAMHQAAFVMMFTCAVTAGVAAAFVW